MLTLFKSIVLVILFVVLSTYVFAANIDSTYQYAWSDSIGWISFKNVEVTDTALTGYLRSDQYGVILMQHGQGGVINDGQGNLSGNAWSEELGLVDFDGVSIDEVGDFYGYVTGDNTGNINVNCNQTNSCANSLFKVKTSWVPIDPTIQEERTVINNVSVSVQDVIGNNGTIDISKKQIVVTGNNITSLLISENESYQGAIWKSYQRETIIDVPTDGSYKKTIYVLARDKWLNQKGPFIKEIIFTQPTIADEEINDQSENKANDTIETKNSIDQQKDSFSLLFLDSADQRGISIAEQFNILPGSNFKIEGFDTVYYFGFDGKRHVYPNDIIYKSYYNDFDKVHTITDSAVGAIPLGGNMKLAAGTWLVKITSDPKVYAVGDEGTLHWVQSEEIAQVMYGNNWQEKIIDIDINLFVDYIIASPLNGSFYPNGTLIQKDERIFIIKEGTQVELTNDQLEVYKPRLDFVIDR